MFNVLIHGNDEAWNDGRVTLERSRFLEYTDDDLKARFKDLDGAAREALMSMPALFANERTCRKGARLGRITEIRPSQKSIDFRFEFYPDMSVSAKALDEHLRVLGIDEKYEIHRTHWAVKHGDIWETGLLKMARAEPEFSLRVFVVHGHDHDLKDKVGKLLQEVGLEPVILHLEADKGRTVIEKFEQSADVGFAVVLLTGDDPMKNGAMRARQNVILEFGYFIGRLGRHRVCALQKGHLDVPSDILGVLCKEVDKEGKWQEELKRELKAAGYDLRSGVMVY